MNKIEFNTQICTTVEQSKRLLELGLNPDTSDMHHDRWSEGYWEIQNCPPRGSNSRFIPAWSLHRLFAMICNYPCEEHFIFEFSMDYDSMVDVYDSTIEVIESHIKENNFNKDYLK